MHHRRGGQRLMRLTRCLPPCLVLPPGPLVVLPWCRLPRCPAAPPSVVPPEMSELVVRMNTDFADLVVALANSCARRDLSVGTAAAHRCSYSSGDTTIAPSLEFLTISCTMKKP